MLDQDRLGVPEWLVTIVRPGISGNDVYFDPEVLREAEPLYRGTAVSVFRARTDFFDHARGAMTPWAQSALPEQFGRVVAAWQAQDGSIKGRLRVEGAEWLQRRLLDAWVRGTEALALSQEADVRGWKEMVGGAPVFLVRRIVRVKRIAVVTPPSASGGGFDQPIGCAPTLFTERMMNRLDGCMRRMEQAEQFSRST